MLGGEVGRWIDRQVTKGHQILCSPLLAEINGGSFVGTVTKVSLVRPPRKGTNMSRKAASTNRGLINVPGSSGKAPVDQ